MMPRSRTWVLAAAAIVLAPSMVALVSAMPAFGSVVAIDGTLVAAIAPSLRSVDNLVSAINFDMRSLDTLGEEFMLLAAVTGTVMLLRGQRGEGTSQEPLPFVSQAPRDRPDSTVLLSRVVAPILFLFGTDLVLSATVTPGGGFQGGAVIATALVLVYLGEGYVVWRRVVVSEWLAAVEGAGAFLFVLAGLVPIVLGKSFMTNILPVGRRGEMFSGGLILVENLGVALAVSGGLLMLFLEYLEETRVGALPDLHP